MERSPYQETTGLWQVTACQAVDSKTAAEMLERQQSSPLKIITALLSKRAPAVKTAGALFHTKNSFKG